MKQYINILLSLFLTITSCQPAFAQTKVDGSLLKGDVIGGTASNTRRLVVPKDTKTNLDAKTRLEANLVYGTDTKKAYIDNGTDLVAVGSGSGGETNYIVNGDADGASASIFIPYADAAGTRPVDGTGGSPTVTTSITSTAPLAGTKSYLLTKPASNVQGQGWAIPFSVDLGYRAKASKITVSYIVNSGTFVAGSDTTESDVIWYLYDVTNSVLIEPSNIKMRASNTVISDLYDAEFQTSATGSSYRLIAHVQSTSALAYELKVDEIKISPNKVTLGPVNSDPQNATCTASWTTNTTTTCKIERDGGFASIEWNLALAGAPNATALSVSLPAGMSVDMSRLVSVGAGFPIHGTASANRSGSATTIYVLMASTTSFYITYSSNTATWAQSIVSNTAPVTWAAGDNIMARIRVPITGWGSSQKISDGYDGRLIALSASISGTQSVPSATATKIVWNTTSNSYDKTASLNTSTGTVTILSSGIYSISGAVNYAASAAAYELDARLYINGSFIKLNGEGKSGTSSIPAYARFNFRQELKAGDTVEIYSVQTSGASLTVRGNGSAQDLTYLNVEKLQSPQSISASEEISARYTTAAGQSITGATDTLIDFGTKDYDSHNAVTTGGSWKFTAPTAGRYRVTAQIVSGNLTWTVAGQVMYGMLFKNGTIAQNGVIEAAKNPGTFRMNAPMSTTIDLKAGDYIDYRIQQSIGGALFASAAHCWINIEKVK